MIVFTGDNLLPWSLKMLYKSWSSRVDRVMESVCTILTYAADGSDALQLSVFRVIAVNHGRPNFIL